MLENGRSVRIVIGDPYRRGPMPRSDSLQASISIPLCLCIAAILFLAVPAAGKKPRRKGPRVNASLHPGAYGVLANEQLMHPVDMSDWPVKITAERQLFVDDYLVASMKNLARRVHPPIRHPGNPVLRLLEKPWEQGFGHSVIVLRDAKSGKFRMWYNLRHRVTAEDGSIYRGPTCYAVSDDGVRWTKPDLGIFKFQGNKNNNICLPQGTIEAMFHEPKDPDPNRRYKALVWHDPYKTKPFAPREGFYLFWSADGVHWTGDSQRCILPNGTGGNFPAVALKGVGDTTNFQWDPKLGKYTSNVKILFRNPSTLRTVGYMESDDLIHWSRPRMVMHRDGLDEGDTQMYEHITFPYESLWIGQVRAMHTKRTGWKQVEVELSASRDGRHWSRICRGQRFLPLGSKDSWDADYLIPGRPGAPIEIGDELWFYYWGSRRVDKRDGDKTVRYAMHIGLAKLRRDGFVSLDAGKKPGLVVTRPLTFAGKKLFLNAEIGRGGYIKAALRDTAGKDRTPYALERCKPITGDVLKAQVTWGGRTTLRNPSGKSLRLAFELKNAKLYSFWIE